MIARILSPYSRRNVAARSNLVLNKSSKTLLKASNRAYLRRVQIEQQWWLPPPPLPLQPQQRQRPQVNNNHIRLPIELKKQWEKVYRWPHLFQICLCLNRNHASTSINSSSNAIISFSVQMIIQCSCGSSCSMCAFCTIFGSSLLVNRSRSYKPAIICIGGWQMQSPIPFTSLMWPFSLELDI